MTVGERCGLEEDAALRPSVTSFDLLGEDCCRQLKLATIDMPDGFIKAIEQPLPHIEIMFDRLSVARLASDAVDAVRREQVRNLGFESGRAIRGLSTCLRSSKRPILHLPNSFSSNGSL